MTLTLTVPLWRDALPLLATTDSWDEEALELYVAGKRNDGQRDYSRIFSRDIENSLLLFLRSEMLPEHVLQKALRSFLLFAASRQGRRMDSFTNEQPGAVPHEVPGVPLRGYNTHYCACDTTALFLILCEAYADRFEDKETIQRLSWPIAWAFSYLRSHLRDGLFLEDPKFSGAEGFALLATYWRDCGIPGRKDRKLVYPASFLLVQAQVIAALRALLRLTQRHWFPAEMRFIEGELRLAREAFRTHFDTGNSPPALDAIAEKEGALHGTAREFVSTDPAHALFYLEPEDVSNAYLEKCASQLQQLETPWGWKSWLDDRNIPGMVFKNETSWIWPWEHGFVAEGAAQHCLPEEIAKVALRPAEYLAKSELPFTEIVNLESGEPLPSGCHVQLWTIAYWSWVERQLQKNTL